MCGQPQLPPACHGRTVVEEEVLGFANPPEHFSEIENNTFSSLNLDVFTHHLNSIFNFLWWKIFKCHEAQHIKIGAHFVKADNTKLCEIQF